MPGRIRVSFSKSGLLQNHCTQPCLQKYSMAITFPPLFRSNHSRRRLLYTFIPLLWGFPGGSDGKESACNAGDLGSIPGLGRSPGEGHMATHSSIKAWRIPWDSLEKGKATHSSILAWRTPWTKKPGRLQSMRSQESYTTERLSLSIFTPTSKLCPSYLNGREILSWHYILLCLMFSEFLVLQRS